MGKGAQTIGFKYFMSLHMGISRGPVNEIVDIRVGNLSAWKEFGNAPVDVSESGQLIQINAPNLFGGDEKEGGIQGPLYFYNGAPDQVLQPAMGSLPSIETTLGGDVPAFRGVLTAWYDGEICAMNPYPKEWAYRLWRTNAGWFDDDPWYPEKATLAMVGTDGEIVHAMNPAHLLFEVNTNPEWGRGMPRELIDENSFIYAANQFCDEGFGLCIPWFRREAIKDFIPIVINHVAGGQYVDRETGKIALRLIRNDYDPDDLPIFGPDSGLLRVEDDDSSSEETAFNEVTITGFDPVRKEDINLSDHSLASYQTLGEIISNAIEYKGLATRNLVARVAARELKAQSVGQRRFTLYMDRRAWRIKPLMPFKISWPAAGIGSMIVRGGEITDQGGELQIKVVQDIFGMPLVSYLNTEDPTWEPPNRTPAPVDEAEMFEVNYRDAFLRTTEAQLNSLVEGDSFIGVVAAPPAGVNSYQFDLATRGAAEDYEVRGRGSYTARARLAYDIAYLDTTAFLDLLPGFVDEFEPGMVAQMGLEQVGVMTLDEETGEVTLKRGVADTIPRTHNIDETVWLVDDEISSDFRTYMDGETVYAKPLPRTSTQVLGIDDATELSVVVDQRIIRPFPPGDVRVGDGMSASDSIYQISGMYPEPVISWTHRDRIIQADMVVGHPEGSVGPEVGTTYRIEVFDEDGTTLLDTYEIDGTTWTYDAALQYDDGAGTFVYMELVSVRDGLESYFAYRFLVPLTVDFLTIDYDPVLIDGEGIIV